MIHLPAAARAASAIHECCSETFLDALQAAFLGLEPGMREGNSGIIQGEFGGIRILSREFGSLGMFCDVAVHMNGAL